MTLTPPPRGGKTWRGEIFAGVGGMPLPSFADFFCVNEDNVYPECVPYEQAVVVVSIVMMAARKNAE